MAHIKSDYCALNHNLFTMRSTYQRSGISYMMFWDFNLSINFIDQDKTKESCIDIRPAPFGSERFRDFLCYIPYSCNYWCTTLKSKRKRNKFMKWALMIFCSFCDFDLTNLEWSLFCKYIKQISRLPLKQLSLIVFCLK